MPGSNRLRGGQVVAPAKDISHGDSRKFQLACDDKTLDGFVVNFKGKFHAYVNRCCHMSVPLDWTENEFFTKDKRHIICLTHGAMYEPDTGICVDGPCNGEYLNAIPVAVHQGQVVVYCPPEWD